MERVSGKIFETDNYDRFKTMTGNRELGRRIRAYLPSIEKYGQIVPIIVNDLNEVVDGQARLECCKRLGLPVSFIIVNGLRLEETVEVNTKSKKWTMVEIIHGNAETGSVSSRYLDNLRTQFPKIDITVLFFALTGIKSSGSDTVNRAKNEPVSAEAYDGAIAQLNYISRMSVYISKVPGSKREFFTAVLWLYQQGKINPDRLENAIAKRYTTIGPMPNAVIAVNQIQELYNWHQRDRVLFAEEYIESLRRKR